MTVDRGLTTPYVWNWTLNVQHAFTPNLSMEAAYVGNHGSNLTGIRDINQPPVGSGWTTDPALLLACQRSAHQLRPRSAMSCADPFNAKFPYLATSFRWEMSTGPTTTDCKSR